MNKTYRTLSLVILSSTLIASATEIVQQNTLQTTSVCTQTTNTIQQARLNKWAKVGMASTACAIIYAVGVRLNIVPAPSVTTLSLLALPVFAKKTIDSQESSQSSNAKEATATTTETLQKAITETVILTNNEEPTENNEQKNMFPNRHDLRDATDALKKWLLNGMHNYTPDYKEDYQ
jgi:hypothetical protein